MKKQFVKIGENRIKVSTIKRYKPQGDEKISIHYSANRNSPQIEVLTLNSKKERDNIIEELDIIMGVVS